MRRGNKNQFKAILFDMDGTLVNSEPLHLRAWRAVLTKYNLPVTDDWFRQWVGVSDVNMISKVVADYHLQVSALQLLEEKRFLFRKKVEQELATFEGVKQGLKNLISFSRAVVTMSNCADARFCLKTTGIEGYFSILISADDVMQHKPHPECYLKAASALSCSPDECIAIEDSISGVQSAKAAGCFTIAVANTMDAVHLQNANLVLESTKAAMGYIMSCSLNDKPNTNLNLS